MTNPSLAIVFFGLTRSLDQTIQSLQTHLFDILTRANIPYAIYQHTYVFRERYENRWSGESTDRYPNESYRILNARKREVEVQEDVIKTIDFDAYYRQPTIWTGEVDPELGKILIRNMILGYRSRQRAFQLLEPDLGSFTHVLFLRPDLQLATHFDTDLLSYSMPSGVFLPEMDSFVGCNDKVLLCESQNAAQIGNMGDYILSYSEQKTIVAESFFLDMLRMLNLKPCLIDLEYNVIRVRSNTTGTT
jgi:hypothetical protein